MVQMTDLRFAWNCLIIAIWGSADRSARPIRSSANTPSLREVLFALRLPNFYLLLLTAAAQLVRLERILRLKLGSPMLGNVSLRHVGRCCEGPFRLNEESLIEGLKSRRWARNGCT
jgi:hypothetical protein